MSPEAVLARLSERGHSITRPRRAIVQFLHQNTSHPTAGEVFAAVSAELPEASRATVYATLALLVEVGALRSLRHSESETRFDPNVSPHHHRECPACGTLEDVPACAVSVTLHGAPVAADVRFTAACETCRKSELDNSAILG